MDLKTLKDYAKGSRYLVMTDKVNYWEKNVKDVFSITSLLDDEEIDYVVCLINDESFHKKKKK